MAEEVSLPFLYLFTIYSFYSSFPPQFLVRQVCVCLYPSHYSYMDIMSQTKTRETKKAAADQQKVKWRRE